MEKGIFLDRDGVISEERSYICKKEDLILLPKAAEAIKLLNENGYKVIVVTNQAAVARGFCTENEINEINNYLQELLKKEGAFIDKFYYCPHHPEMHPDTPEHVKKYRIKCECRKPLPGMILQGAKEFNIDLNQSFMVGDMITDIIAGKSAGCKTIMIESPNNNKVIKSHVDVDEEIKYDYFCKNLYQAATDIILNKKLKIFINAGGKGERLYPITKDIPKPLVPVCGKPVLEHLIEWAKSYGIGEVILMNGHMADKIVEYFGNGEKFGIKVTHSNEPYPLGSGGPLKFARKHIDGKFVHMSGDHICDLNLRKMIDFHEKNNSQITVLVHKSTHPHDSDILNIDENGKVTKFISKHDDHTGAGELTNSGLAIIEPEIIYLMEEEVFNFENYLYPILLSKNMRFYAYNSDEFMHDMGTPERLKKCENYLKNKMEGVL